ncbi:hypothetical protein J1614_008978 [Plenodomus biglobosus]|nr:hypothetical protein J1614_008978 [Plenodomus biglobosus]
MIAGYWRIGDTDSLVRVDNMTREHKSRCHERLQASFFSLSDFTGSKTKMNKPFQFHSDSAHEVYDDVRLRALQQLHIPVWALYVMTWRFFLSILATLFLSNFNTLIHDEFRQFALEDSFGTKLSMLDFHI